MMKKFRDELGTNSMILVFSLIQVLFISSPETTKTSLCKYWLISFAICMIIRYCGALILYTLKNAKLNY